MGIEPPEFPPFRAVFLQMFVEEPLIRSGEIAAALRATLATYGEVRELSEDGECDDRIEFNAYVVPPDRAHICLEAMGIDAGDGWWSAYDLSSAVFDRRRAPNSRFLHDNLVWACIDWVEAWTLPRFQPGDAVLVTNTGLAATVKRLIAPDIPYGPWSYSVHPASAAPSTTADSEDLVDNPDTWIDCRDDELRPCDTPQAT
ncbi:hypothetical protein [Nocardia sp. CDC160]|uniref:hypothetical protein n=1 Tax=Nocardia sp. CDC160 TaxID=3112166 RepID=UPI002DB9E6D5|nr:hypothetical protein [Nocardia sp. CDC160]MEC3920240.1 hypothetical protein [Nocardia sp. CDC160]